MEGCCSHVRVTKGRAEEAKEGVLEVLGAEWALGADGHSGQQGNLAGISVLSSNIGYLWCVVWENPFRLHWPAMAEPCP